MSRTGLMTPPAQRRQPAAGEEHTPLIGVLCIDVAQKLQEIYGAKIKSYIAASYVKYLESAGAQVVPIWLARPRAYYEQIMQHLNGILIPGGAVFFNAQDYHNAPLNNACVESSKYIYEIAAAKNAAGDFFPIWGTCLGYQLLILHSANGVNPREDCTTMQCSLPLHFEKDFRQSHMFANLPQSMEDIMRKQPVGYHYHRFCITKQTLKQLQVAHEWQVLATNKDDNGLEFITIVEHNRFPYYACQFHPERVCYENFGNNDSCVHTDDCMEAARYFAKMFVAVCRKSPNRFDSIDEELRHLIWNFTPTFTGREGAHWLQCYLFEQDTDYPKAVDAEEIVT